LNKNFSVFLILGVTLALIIFAGGFYLGTHYKSETVVPVETRAPEEILEEPSQSGKINLNTASAEELTELPGIGEKLSAAIITYRSEIGSFQSIWQLDAVPGIGQKTIEKIEPYLTLS